jgi:hypothetical protein
MIFNNDPLANIPYGTQTTVFYKWYAGTYWAYSNPSLGDRDGTLSISHFNDDPPVSYHLQYEDGSLWSPHGRKSFTLSGSSSPSVWTYTKVDGQYTQTGAVSQSFADLIIANPEFLWDNSSGSSFLVYENTDVRILSKPIRSKLLLKPQIKDYFTGYYLDAEPYKLDLSTSITPSKTGIIKLHYYLLEDEIQADFDGVLHPTVSIQTLQLNLTKSIPYQLNIKAVPCSISLEGDNDLCNDIRIKLNTANQKCFPEYLPVIKSHWENLYELNKITLLNSPHLVTSIELTSTPYIWAATPRWNQQSIADRNTEQGIGEYIPSSFIYDKYFKPQPDGTFGGYIMPDSALVKKIANSLNVDEYQLEVPEIVGTGTVDNPQTPALHKLDWYIRNSAGSKVTAIWKALGKDKYAVNELDNTKDRVPNIGFLVQQIARLLGYDPDANGNIDNDLQKTVNETQCADIRKPLDTDNYSPYGFGKKGIAIANLPNDYDGSNPKNGGGSLVTNIPNLMLELHSQLNKSLGIQDSSNIVFAVNNRKVHYSNQAALLVDLARTVAMMSQLLNTVYTNSLQTESQVREIIGALGLGTTDDSIGLTINGQPVNIPFKGVDRRESLVNELADIKLTLAVIAGKLI